MARWSRGKFGRRKFYVYSVYRKGKQKITLGCDNEVEDAKVWDVMRKNGWDFVGSY